MTTKKRTSKAIREDVSKLEARRSQLIGERDAAQNELDAAQDAVIGGADTSTLAKPTQALEHAQSVLSRLESRISALNAEADELATIEIHNAKLEHCLELAKECAAGKKTTEIALEALAADGGKLAQDAVAAMERWQALTNEFERAFNILANLPTGNERDNQNAIRQAQQELLNAGAGRDAFTLVTQNALQPHGVAWSYPREKKFYRNEIAGNLANAAPEYVVTGLNEGLQVLQKRLEAARAKD